MSLPVVYVYLLLFCIAHFLLMHFVSESFLTEETEMKLTFSSMNVEKKMADMLISFHHFSFNVLPVTNRKNCRW